MPADPSRERRATAPLAVLFAALCLAPHLLRLGHPSLYCDDVVRVGQLREHVLGTMLFLPFNEHMAPAFQSVSWLTWRLAGRRLVFAPLAFTLASFLPFVLSLAALGRLIRRDLGSWTTALGAVAVLALSSTDIEVAWWYSASSFTWALFWTLAALLCLGRARDGGWTWWLGAALATLMAPACSAIGLLAGPIGAVYVGSMRDRDSSRRFGFGFRALIPPIGTALYLAICGAFRYRLVVAESVRRHGDLSAGLRAVVRAPVEVLVPGLFGFQAARAGLPIWIAATVFALGLIVALVWASRSERRALILAGLLMVVGGYALAFGVRARPGDDGVLRVQRYQLFPLVGLLLLLSVASRRWLARLDTRPNRGLAVVCVVAALLLMFHLPTLRARARMLRFPEQPQTLAAMERLGAVCQREGITRDQALRALDSIQPRWFPFWDLNALIMLGPGATTPRVPDPLVRSTLLAAFSTADREAFCGAMNASTYLQPDAQLAQADAIATGRLVKSYRVRAEGSEGRYVSAGGSALLEFEMPDRPSGRGAPRDASPSPRVLYIPGSGAIAGMELWWTDRSAGWSEARSVHWQPDPSRSPGGSVVPLDQLPHWRADKAQRVRVFLRSDGPVAIGAPRWLR